MPLPAGLAVKERDATSADGSWTETTKWTFVGAMNVEPLAGCVIMIENTPLD
jgi:hypothetical protein